MRLIGGFVSFHTLCSYLFGIVIGTWGGFPSNPQWPGWRYLAEAHFNLIGPIVWHPSQTFFIDCASVLLAAEAVGLQAILVDQEIQQRKIAGPIAWEKKAAALSEEFSRNKHLFGYFLFDEPSASGFSDLATATATFEKHDPAHPTFINLFPTYANNSQLGTDDYEAYVDRFLKEVQPKILSYDHYALKKENTPTNSYFRNLRIIRDGAERANIPFWNTIQLKGWNNQRVPNETDLFWQVYTSLAYGAQGIFYWHIANNGGDDGGILTVNGNRSEPLYSFVRQLNLEISRIDTFLGKRKHAAIYELEKEPSTIKGSLLSIKKKLPIVVGEFVGAQDTVLLLVNKSLDQTVSIPIQVDQSVTQIEQFEPANGKHLSILADQFEIKLPPGRGILLRLNRSSQSP